MISFVNRNDFLAEIEECLEPYFTDIHYSSGQHLWNQGDKASKMIRLVKGRVKIFRMLPNGRPVPIYIFGKGDTFGFLPFIDGSEYPASAQTIEKTDARIITRKNFEKALRNNPDMALFLLNHLGKRLRQAFDQIERLSNVKVTQKIASAFLSLFLEPIKKDSEIICLPVTSKEYANFLGLTPESFSRGITKLEDEGIIQRLGNNCFKIADKQRLFTQSEA